MISSRHINELDRSSVNRALAQDKFHVGTQSDSFYQHGVVTNIYEDEEGPIMLVRASKSLRIDLLFFENADVVRNKAAMLAGFQKLVENAKASGFLEITTSTNSPALLKFATKKIEDGGFGFEKVQTAENSEVALRRVL